MLSGLRVVVTAKKGVEIVGKRVDEVGQLLWYSIGFSKSSTTSKHRMNGLTPSSKKGSGLCNSQIRSKVYEAALVSRSIWSRSKAVTLCPKAKSVNNNINVLNILSVVDYRKCAANKSTFCSLYNIEVYMY